MYLTTEIDAADIPQRLCEATRVAQHPSQADMLLLSLLTASGYAMPHYYMRAGNPARRYEPALMSLIVAPPASGKGIMNLSRRILQPLHEHMRRQTEEALARAQSREDEEQVAQRMAFIPGNCSSNALLQILRDNDGRGCIVETEMDVISQIWRRDYGNYSTLLRQAFEHETVSKARKTKTDAYLEVKHPSLSVLLSGTPGQLQPLLQSRENGLASRFLCYMAGDLIDFDQSTIIKHSEEHNDEADRILGQLADQTTRMYDWLCGQDTECEWRMTDAQSDALRDYWGGNHEVTLKVLQMPTTFDSVVKRLAVSMQRIGMILSMMRHFEEEVQPRLEVGEKVPVPEVLECTDRDFRAMLVFADVLTEHAIGVHYMLPAEEVCIAAEQESVVPEAATALLASLPEQFTSKDAADAGHPATDRTIRNYLTALVEAGIVKKVGHGKYQKKQNN